jgi:hypothetical protein
MRMVRLTYPIGACTCPAVPGGHLYTDRCPPPRPLRREVSTDGGATWRDVDADGAPSGLPDRLGGTPTAAGGSP